MSCPCAAVIFMLPALAWGESPVELHKAADPSVDRNVLLPTAETVKAGDFAFSDYEIMLVGGTYGVTDDLQLTVTTLLPITSDIPLFLIGSAKYRLFSGDHLVFSVQPSVIYTSFEGNRGGLFGFQLLADLVLDSEGRIVLHFAEGNQWVFGGASGGDIDVAGGVALFAGAGLSARLGQHVKILAEVTVPGAYSKDTDKFELVDKATLFNYGVRFFGEMVAVDLTFIKPIGTDSGKLWMGVPYVSFSARF
jgi:hypothetical protein